MRDCPVIILAAGESSRLGSPKGLVEIEGRYWLQKQREDLRRVGLGRHIIVLGHHADEYLKLLPGIPFVRNPNPELGPFSSLQEGLSCIHPREEGVFVLPVDVPCAEGATWRGLQDTFRDTQPEGAWAAVPEHEGRGGHPVLLSRELIELILRVNPEAAGARLDVQLKRLSVNHVTRVSVKDPKVLGNLNSAEEWYEFTRQSEARPVNLR